jgi:hypothetical protein
LKLCNLFSGITGFSTCIHTGATCLIVSAILVFFFLVIHEKVSAIDIFVVDSGVDTLAGAEYD